MRVIVCGGRTFSDRGFVYRTLDGLLKDYDKDDLVIIQGGAKGADRFGRDWALANHVMMINYPADWDGLGDQAGYVRNRKMLVEGRPDLVLAFPTPGELNKGTTMMMRIARNAGVKVIDAVEEGKKTK